LRREIFSRSQVKTDKVKRKKTRSKGEKTIMLQSPGHLCVVTGGEDGRDLSGPNSEQRFGFLKTTRSPATHPSGLDRAFRGGVYQRGKTNIHKTGLNKGLLIGKKVF